MTIALYGLACYVVGMVNGYLAAMRDAARRRGSENPVESR